MSIENEPKPIISDPLKAHKRDRQEHMNTLNERVDELERVSITDELTGLLNRRGFHEQSMLSASRIRNPEEIRRREGEIGHLVIGIFDIDSFKNINDTYGHDTGDEVIREVGKYLGNLFNRAGDIVARIGGEEFTVALEGATTEDILKKLGNDPEKQKEAKIEIPFLLENGETIIVTVSGGITEYITQEGVDKALKRADEMLYLSKGNGRNRITAYRNPSTA